MVVWQVKTGPLLGSVCPYWQVSFCGCTDVYRLYRLLFLFREKKLSYIFFCLSAQNVTCEANKSQDCTSAIYNFPCRFIYLTTASCWVWQPWGAVYLLMVYFTMAWQASTAYSLTFSPKAYKRRSPISYNYPDSVSKLRWAAENSRELNAN